MLVFHCLDRVVNMCRTMLCLIGGMSNHDGGSDGKYVNVALGLLRAVVEYPNVAYSRVRCFVKYKCILFGRTTGHGPDFHCSATTT